MAERSKPAAGLVYYRCPRCEKDTLYLACDNCHRTGEFRLEKNVAAVCDCGHRHETYACPCGATVHAKFFYRDAKRERDDRARGVPERRTPEKGIEVAAVGATAYGWFKAAYTVKGQATFAASIVGIFIPAGLGKIFGESASFFHLLLVTAPMTIGVAMSVRLLLSDMDFSLKLVLACLGFIGTAALGILLGALGGVSVGEIGAKHLSGIAAPFEIAYRAITVYYRVYGPATFYSFLGVGAVLGGLWAYLRRDA